MPPERFRGVFTEEISVRGKAIEGVPTSTAGFLGITERGPVVPTLITSFEEYKRIYGGYLKEGAENRYLTYAIEGFFQNGGWRCYVARVVASAAGTATADFIGALQALGKIDEISILCCPDENSFPAIRAELVAQCESRKDRFAILQAPNPAPQSATHYPPVTSEFAAYYHPWIRGVDPTTHLPLAIPPGGHVAGIYARTDTNRGVHKPPANKAIAGLYEEPENPSAGLITLLTNSDQEILKPRGVNALRFFANRGVLVWGARTTSNSPEWKYVNVRRLFIFISASIDKGTQWVVFEPNEVQVWAQVRALVEAFLVQLWRDGALTGTTSKEAFFVRCDRTTMTQDDIDNGRLIILIGVAALRPAEFIIVRIGQWTADSKLNE